jgi:hypothetical protein
MQFRSHIIAAVAMITLSFSLVVDNVLARAFAAK